MERGNGRVGIGWTAWLRKRGRGVWDDDDGEGVERSRGESRRGAHGLV